MTGFGIPSAAHGIANIKSPSVTLCSVYFKKTSGFIVRDIGVECEVVGNGEGIVTAD
jgi:hypothetical protein